MLVIVDVNSEMLLKEVSIFIIKIIANPIQMPVWLVGINAPFQILPPIVKDIFFYIFHEVLLLI